MEESHGNKKNILFKEESADECNEEEDDELVALIEREV
jgi:hypothetical protein